MANTSKVTIHMVSSLDGFIAKKDGSVDWLQATHHYDQGVSLSDKEIAEFLATIDCYIMGSHTYETALKLGWPYGEKPVTVLTHRNLSTDRPNVHFYSGDLTTLINDELRPQYPSIWAVGGSMLTQSLLRQHLVDEIIVSIMPIILGGGTLFFDAIGQEQRLRLLDTKAYNNGIVELKYATQ